MGFTRGSRIFECTKEQAQFVANCAGLRHVFGDKSEFYNLYHQWLEKNPHPGRGNHEEEWRDRSNAEESRIKKLIGNVPESDYGDAHDLWEDYQTGGGGCRIVWCQGIVWISRHSGYEWADITESVAETFAEIGCKTPDPSRNWWRFNPHIYGYRDWAQQPYGRRNPGVMFNEREGD